MASTEQGAPAAATEQPPAAPETTATPAAVPASDAPAADAPAAAEGAAAEGAAPEGAVEGQTDEKAGEKKERTKAERLEKRKQQRKAAREAAKEAKANGEPPKPRAPRAEKATGDAVVGPEGGAPKISVAKLPEAVTTQEVTELFAAYGQVLRAELSKRKGRPTLATIVYNTHAEVRKAVNALHNKHKFPGESDAITIQYTKDSLQWGETVKKATDEVADTLKQFEYKPSLLRSKDTKDFINRAVFMRRKIPTKEVLTAALLVSAGTATADELVACKMVESAAPVQQLLREDKDKMPKVEARPSTVAGGGARGRKEEPAKAAPKIEKTFDAVVPFLDKLEKERWNRMAKANLRLSERYRFRFVDILHTPSLELWRWMVEDCDITPAEAGTCFAILQTHYGFSK